jgi:hypothetical protein
MTRSERTANQLHALAPLMRSRSLQMQLVRSLMT